MGLPFRTYIDSTQVWACSKCNTHITDNKAIMSKQFQGHHGRGYLFRLAENLKLGKEESRSLSTGKHLVRDLFCRVCNVDIGWKYIKAYETTEVYKEGKFLLVGRVHLLGHGNASLVQARLLTRRTHWHPRRDTTAIQERARIEKDGDWSEIYGAQEKEIAA